MAATDSVTLAKINHCCREGYYRQLQNICLETLQKYGHDPVLVFWKAFGILMEEQISEAISELEGIKEKRDVILCSCMALIIAHKRTKMVDKETVKQLEVKLKSERTTCGETALYFAGMFLFHSGRPEKAKEYIERMLKMAPQSKELTGIVKARSAALLITINPPLRNIIYRATRTNIAWMDRFKVAKRSIWQESSEVFR